MITVTFYSNFTKRVNSTLRPAGGTNVSVLLKEETSIEKPTFILSGTVSTFTGYNYALWDGRYYYVTDVRIQTNGVVAIDCDMDRLATYKIQIGASSQYIERAKDGSKDIRDELLSWTDETRTKAWDVGRVMPDSTFYDYATYNGGTGGLANNWYNDQHGIIACYLVSADCSALAGGASGLYIFDAENSATSPCPFYALATILTDSSIWGSLTNIVNNVHDVCIKVMYIPWVNISAFATGGEFADAFDLVDIVIGDRIFTGTKAYKHKYARLPILCRRNFDVDLSTVVRRPYHGFDYMWANCEPYSKWYLYLPFYGTIEVPMEEFISDSNDVDNRHFFLQSFYDISTGELEYQLVKPFYPIDRLNVQRRSYMIYGTYRTTLGVSIPVSQITGSPKEFMSSLVATAAAVASQHYALAATSAAAGVVALNSQHNSAAGSFGSTGVSMTAIEPLNAYLVQVTKEPAEAFGAFAASMGLPVRKRDQISNYDGYIKCRNASVDIPGHEEDKNAVNAFLNSGFFYE